MKRFLFVAVLFLAFGLSSCQCSDKPEIGPVEDGGPTATLPVDGRPMA